MKAAEGAGTTRDDLVTETLAYRASGVEFRGQFVYSTAVRPRRSGVLIAPDWRGLSPYSAEQAASLARMGHDVMVADLYGDGLRATNEAEASGLLKGLLENRPGVVDRMQACLAAFLGKLSAGTPVVALGYSIGGMTILDLGRSGAALAGLILNSALLLTAQEGGPTRISAPVLVLHGTLDVVCPMAKVSALIAEMDAAGNACRVVLYGGAHHSFYNPAVGTDPNARLVYSTEVDRLAREEIARFLQWRLGRDA